MDSTLDVRTATTACRYWRRRDTRFIKQCDFPTWQQYPRYLHPDLFKPRSIRTFQYFIQQIYWLPNRSLAFKFGDQNASLNTVRSTLSIHSSLPRACDSAQRQQHARGQNEKLPPLARTSEPLSELTVTSFSQQRFCLSFSTLPFRSIIIHKT